MSLQDGRATLNMDATLIREATTPNQKLPDGYVESRRILKSSATSQGQMVMQLDRVMPLSGKLTMQNHDEVELRSSDTKQPKVIHTENNLEIVLTSE